MAIYTAEELNFDGILSEAFSGTKVFAITNPSGSSYFTLETIHRGDGEYDETSPRNTEGIFNNLVQVQSLIQSPYIASFEVSQGSASFYFTPDAAVSADSLFLRATGNISLVITNAGSK